jgi:alkylation response protein AidB-like acyl-CoA dehydrogenase
MGWYVAMTTLENERSGIRDVANCQRQFDHLLDGLREGEGIHGVRRDRVARHKLAELAIEIEVTRQLAYRIAWMQTQGMRPTREPAIAKMFGTDLEQKITQTGMQLLGLYGPLRMHSRRELSHGNVVEEYLHAVSPTISAGSNEVQRNIIATRGLGLPR